MLLSLVAVSLAQCNDLHVMQAGVWGEIDSLAEEHTPDVLIYDITAASESHILLLLFKYPFLLLIGLDEETNRGVMLAGKETLSLTMDRVKEIVMTY